MTTLRHGDRGQGVRTLQIRLNRQGARVEETGLFGDLTEAAVRTYQHKVGLVADGVAGEKTNAALAGFDLARLLDHATLEAGAARLGVPLPTLMAVNEVESLGMGFLENGKPKILLERHVLYRQLPAGERDALAECYPQLVHPQAGGYVGGSGEHARLALARDLAGDCALAACSWGAFQVMGYHAERLGYPSVAVFTEQMGMNEHAQFEAFLRFIEHDPALHKALKARRWATFAERYNGPAYRRNLYDTRLERAYARHAEALQAFA
ncbi:N-acetylmuramidase domain-containing protein [Pseudomonas japonica]|uniref:N-acetylmuramidase domain-containing protein n=1 Tax=Pseudomonas japonica TaxID=256466 RepID=UPI0015E4159D|nr:N-acetylmuramidase family protein [Pseudomonas japonica]MBA1289183.1 DUF3380 domain-containing protein [Pseudomonas japonica]